MIMNLMFRYTRVFAVIALFSSMAAFSLPQEVELELELYQAFFAKSDTQLSCRSVAELIKAGAKGDFAIIVDGVVLDFPSLAVVDFKSHADALTRINSIVTDLEANRIDSLKAHEHYRKELVAMLFQALETSKKMLEMYTQRHKEMGGLVKKAKPVKEDEIEKHLMVHFVLAGIIANPRGEAAEVVNYFQSECSIVIQIAGKNYTFADVVLHICTLWQKRFEMFQEVVMALASDPSESMQEIIKVTLDNAMSAVGCAAECKKLEEALLAKSSDSTSTLEQDAELEALLKKNKRR